MFDSQRAGHQSTAALTRDSGEPIPLALVPGRPGTFLFVASHTPPNTAVSQYFSKKRSAIGSVNNGFFKELLTFTGGVGKWGDELIVFASMNAGEFFREVIILIGVLGLSVTI